MAEAVLNPIAQKITAGQHRQRRAQRGGKRHQQNALPKREQRAPEQGEQRRTRNRQGRDHHVGGEIEHGTACGSLFNIVL
ncbi:hypothetical protein D3C80_1836130 [compost metagenome]